MSSARLLGPELEPTSGVPRDVCGSTLAASSAAAHQRGLQLRLSESCSLYDVPEGKKRASDDQKHALKPRRPRPSPPDIMAVL